MISNAALVGGIGANSSRPADFLLRQPAHQAQLASDGAAADRRIPVPFSGFELHLPQVRPATDKRIRCSPAHLRRPTRLSQRRSWRASLTWLPSLRWPEVHLRDAHQPLRPRDNFNPAESHVSAAMIRHFTMPPAGGDHGYAGVPGTGKGSLTSNDCDLARTSWPEITTADGDPAWSRHRRGNRRNGHPGRRDRRLQGTHQMGYRKTGRHLPETARRRPYQRRHFRKAETTLSDGIRRPTSGSYSIRSDYALPGTPWIRSRKGSIASRRYGSIVDEPSRAFTSKSTMSLAISGTRTCGFQPNCASAFDASPINASTSAGRR